MQHSLQDLTEGAYGRSGILLCTARVEHIVCLKTTKWSLLGGSVCAGTVQLAIDGCRPWAVLMLRLQAGHCT